MSVEYNLIFLGSCHERSDPLCKALKSNNWKSVWWSKGLHDVFHSRFHQFYLLAPHWATHIDDAYKVHTGPIASARSHLVHRRKNSLFSKLDLWPLSHKFSLHVSDLSALCDSFKKRFIIIVGRNLRFVFKINLYNLRILVLCWGLLIDQHYHKLFDSIGHWSSGLVRRLLQVRTRLPGELPLSKCWILAEACRSAFPMELSWPPYCSFLKLWSKL